MRHLQRTDDAGPQSRKGPLSLIRSILQRALAEGSVPRLTEWDNDVPPFPVLVGDVARAHAALPVHARRSRRLAR